MSNRVKIGYSGVFDGRVQNGDVTVDRPARWSEMTVAQRDVWTHAQVQEELGSWATSVGYREV